MRSGKLIAFGTIEELSGETGSLEQGYLALVARSNGAAPPPADDQGLSWKSKWRRPRTVFHAGRTRAVHDCADRRAGRRGSRHARARRWTFPLLVVPNHSGFSVPVDRAVEHDEVLPPAGRGDLRRRVGLGRGGLGAASATRSRGPGRAPGFLASKLTVALGLSLGRGRARTSGSDRGRHHRFRLASVQRDRRQLAQRAGTRRSSTSGLAPPSGGWPSAPRTSPAG